MSLTGLDTPEVNEAYQSAIAEAGGWFLLKYTSRENVELLGRGKAGVHEARAALAKYDETSPLYGLLIYRRRKILIKYIPEGTSRVLQARTAVHFQDITERYSPYETLLEITTADSLNDTSLAASFPLHTASPAASSNRLHEISEDGEDHGPRPPLKQDFGSTGSIFGTQRYRSERRVDQLMSGDRVRRTTPAIRVTEDQALPLTAPAQPKKPSLSQFLVRDESGQRSITSLSTHPSVASIGEYPSSEDSGRTVETTATEHEPRPHVNSPTSRSNDSKPVRPAMKSNSPATQQSSSNTASSPETAELRHPMEQHDAPEATTPNIDDDPYDLSRFDYLKPKIKLGPRPVASGERRTMAASTAAIPASMRTVQKRQDLSKPKPQDPGKVRTQYSIKDLPAPPPVPNLPEYSPRPVSRGSIKSLPSHKSTSMTPDKLRLMKAVELRKKQLRKSNPQPSTFVPPEDEVVPAMPSAPAGLQPLERHQLSVRAPAVKEVLQQTKKPDSGIEMSYDPGHHQADAISEPEPHEERRPSTPVVASEKPEPEQEQPVSAGEAEIGSETAPVPSFTSAIPALHSSQLEETAILPSLEMEADKNRPLQTTNGPDTVALSTMTNAAVVQPGTDNQNVVPANMNSLERLGETHVEPTMSLDMLDNFLGPTQKANVDLSRSDAAMGSRDVTGAGKSEEADVPLIVVPAGSRPVTPDGEGTRQLEEVVQNNKTSSPVDAITESGTLEPEQVSPRRAGDLARRRRGIVEPLQLEPHADGDIASDDELMDELQSATVQDATPMTFSRSPMTATFAKRPSEYSESVRSISIRRSSSNMLDASEFGSDRASPVPTYVPTSRNTSSTTPPMEKADARPALSRKVSSGIDRRVQALAEASSRDISPDSTTRVPTPEQSSHAVWRERHSTVKSPLRSRPSSLQRVTRQTSRLSSHALSREHSVESAPVWNAQQDPILNRNSVSVTARIVRPKSDQERDEETAGDAPLQPSKIVVNHQRASQAQLNKALPPLNTGSAAPHAEAISSHWASVTNMPPLAQTSSSSEYRTLHSAGRKSFGRHRSSINTFSNQSPMTPSADDFPPPPLQGAGQQQQPVSRASTVPSTASSNDDSAAFKDGSRTSRFFKRMSNFGGKDKRKSGAQVLSGLTSGSAEVATSANVARSASQDRTDMPPSVVVGDLNVQFPDSLLWKRRLVEIDSSGYLLFTTANQRGVTKRFHLSELKQPYAPDLDVQELPHSVVFDFVDGGTTLQAATEDAMTHRQVLHLLKVYWRSWAPQ